MFSQWNPFYNYTYVCVLPIHFYWLEPLATHFCCWVLEVGHQERWLIAG